MKNPLQMYSKIGDLKIIQIGHSKESSSALKGKDNKPGTSNSRSSFAFKLKALNQNRQNLVSSPSRSTDSLGFAPRTLKFVGQPPYLPALAGKKSVPLHHFIGSLNKKLTTGIIISSKINQLRKDGMSFKYFRYNYLLSQDIGKLSKQPLTYEYKISSNPLLAKKYIKIINGHPFYDL